MPATGFKQVMINQRSGFCHNCNANVVHIRTFRRRIWYRFDQWSHSFFGKLGLGPWCCVDCKETNWTLAPTNPQVKSISDKTDSAAETQRVGNYLRTDHSLTHQIAQSNRFSTKFRQSVAEKLMRGKSTIRQTSIDLGISTKTLEQWIEEFEQDQLGPNLTKQGSSDNSIIPRPASLPRDKSVDYGSSDTVGKVIEGCAIRKPR